MYSDRIGLDEAGAEKLRQIKKQYGVKRLRLLQGFVKSGLNEKFWFAKTKHIKPPNQQLVLVVGRSPIEVNEQCNLLAKKMLITNSGLKCRVVSFYEIMLGVHDKFGRKEIFEGLVKQQCIVIPDIVHSNFYAMEHSNFIALLTYLLNHNVKIVLGLQLNLDPTANKVRKVYGDLANFYASAAIIKTGTTT